MFRTVYKYDTGEAGKMKGRSRTISIGKLAEKHGEKYSVIISFLRRRIYFDMLHSCLILHTGVMDRND